MQIPPIPVWEEKWGHERLKSLAEENPRAFARGFRMQAHSDEELMFPSWAKCCVPGLVTGELARRGMPTFVGVDLASDKRPGTAITVVGLEESTQRRYLVESMRGSWTSPETAAQLGDICARHPNVRIIMVENNAYQQSLIDWIDHDKRQFGSIWAIVEPFTTGRNKASPTYGLPSLEVEFSNEAWTIPTEWDGHSVTCQCGWCVINREFRSYPRGTTSDSVMSLWFARAAVQKWGAPPADVDLRGLSIR